MAPAEDAQETRCPVCDTELTPEAGRRCPRCRARTLWRPPPPALDPGVVLFNLRLCGIMAGVQLAMLALLVAGYRLPIPWGVALAAAALPVGGYVIASELARLTPAAWRAHLLAGVLAFNGGLVLALLAAVVGLEEPVALAGLAVGAAAVIAPLIRRAVVGWGA